MSAKISRKYSGGVLRGSILTNLFLSAGVSRPAHFSLERSGDDPAVLDGQLGRWRARIRGGNQNRSDGGVLGVAVGSEWSRDQGISAWAGMQKRARGSIGARSPPPGGQGLASLQLAGDGRWGLGATGITVDQ